MASTFIVILSRADGEGPRCRSAGFPEWRTRWWQLWGPSRRFAGSGWQISCGASRCIHPRRTTRVL